VCLLTLWTFSPAALACCTQPPPGNCYYCYNGVWVRYGDCWSGCPACESCPSCWCECNAECGCEGRTCPTCESCVNCSCQCIAECCQDSHCGPPGCWDCIGCECQFACATGQNCCGGSCCSNACCNGVCCGAGQICCNDTCCNKVWTTATVSGSIESCPGCQGILGSCPGTTTEINDYLVCAPAEGGQGGHCGCNTTMQVVGHIYPCMRNWDIEKMLWCAGRGLWCTAVCIVTMDPAKCANCLAGAGTDCCGGDGCEVCDFIEACEKDNSTSEPVIELVFSGFVC
jgi:hypothetical protein